ncbi:hypothetical protein, partial [Streptomyces sp. NPDC002690]
ASASGAAGCATERRAALAVLLGLSGPVPGWPVGAYEELADALERAGFPHTASRTALEAATTALAEGDASMGRWERWLALAGDRPGCLDAVRVHAPGPLPEEAVDAVVAGLLAGGSATGGLAAVRLVTQAAGRGVPSGRWAARLRELTAHGRPEVVEAALVARLRQWE